MDYESPDETVDDFSPAAFDGADNGSYADDYLLNDIGVAMRLRQERP